MNPDYYDILDQCLGAILSGDTTIDTCLAKYPQYATELKAELQIAVLTSQLKTPVMDDSAVDSLEARLMSLAKSPKKSSRIISFPRISRAVAGFLIAFVMIVGGSGAVVAASADSMPGDPLYGVKRFWESVIVLLASITGQLDDVSIQLAETRLDEVRQLAERGELQESHVQALQKATENALNHADGNERLFVFLQMTQTTLLSDPSFSSPVGDDLFVLIEPVLQPDEPQINITPTVVILPTETPTSTATPTATDTATMTFTSTATQTPRIPPTATKTPTITPSLTLTATETLIPSPTATDFPTLTQPPTLTPTTVIEPSTVPVGQTNMPIATTAPRTLEPTATWYPWFQATWDACQLTRTVEPDFSLGDRYCP